MRRKYNMERSDHYLSTGKIKKGIRSAKEESSFQKAKGMKDLCIANIVNAPYQGYVPFFIYFAGKSYPEYDIFIYKDAEFDEYTKESLKILKSLSEQGEIGNFKIKDIDLPYSKKTSQSFKTVRWILHDKEFYNYDSVYFGDIDIMLMKEDVKLHEFHLQHCETEGLPYSNLIRPNDDTKMRGLHFIKTKEYFEKTLPAIKKYRGVVRHPATIDNHNERVLKKIIEESGLGFYKENTVDACWHHGIHLRIFCRVNKRLSMKGFHFDPFTFIPYSSGYLKVMGDPVCEELLKIASNRRYGRGNNVIGQMHNAQRVCGFLEKQNNSV